MRVESGSQVAPKMNTLVDARPDVRVQPAEYCRLLGYPQDRVLQGRARELDEWARSWYAEHGRPWVYAREADRFELVNGSILIDGVRFTSPRLHRTLQQAGAHSVMLVAVSAGPEVEQTSAQLWKEEKPDEYFFLEVFGSAVVEHLTTTVGARLCAWAEERDMAVLPHYSPGYPDWDIVEQPRLLDLMHRGRGPEWPYAIEALDSGALRPKKSLLAIFGLTRQTDRLRRLTELVPCERCSFSPCQYRRAPYARARRGEAASFEPTGSHLGYTTNPKALKRWATERLSLESRADGTTTAVFWYDGTTCTNMGRPLTFLYTVQLGPRADGYRIRDQQCGAAPGDTGHALMCRYLNDRERLMAAIEAEKPLLGERLDAVLTWQRPKAAAGCYCEAGSREHKWGLVLETIHYALNNSLVAR